MQTISLIHIFYKGEDGVWKYHATFYNGDIRAIEKRDKLDSKDYETVMQVSNWDLPD